MEKYKEINLDSINIRLESERIVFEAVAKHMRVEFSNVAKQYALAASLINEDNMQFLEIFATTILAGLNIPLMEGGYELIWSKLSSGMNLNVSLLDDEETEEDIIEELKGVEDAKRALLS